MSDEDLEIQEEADVQADSDQSQPGAAEPAEPQAPSVEDRAREMGWRPKEEFKGDEERWVDAETFVERGETVLPIVQARLRKTEDQLRKAEQDAEERFKRLEAMNEKARARERAAYEKRLKDLEAAEKRAEEDYDFDAYRQIQQERRELEQDAPQEQPQNNAVPRDVQEWLGRNQWFQNDVGARAYAQAKIAEEAQRQGRQLSAAEEMKIAEDVVRPLFPHHFGQTAPKPTPRTPSPETGSAAGQLINRKRGKGVSDLPEEARRDGEREVRDGVYASMEDYAKDYWNLP